MKLIPEALVSRRALVTNWLAARRDPEHAHLTDTARDLARKVVAQDKIISEAKLAVTAAEQKIAAAHAKIASLKASCAALEAKKQRLLLDQQNFETRVADQVAALGFDLTSRDQLKEEQKNEHHNRK